MRIHFRLTRTLYESVMVDLRRRHPIAFERVGFLTARTGMVDSQTQLLLALQYDAVRDEDYLPDPTSGACINGTAIRTAVERALQEQVAILHVHLHEHDGRPWFSTIDLQDNPRIVASCRVAAPAQPHGMIVLSKDSVAGMIWLPKSNESAILKKCSIVGYPTEVLQ